MLPVLVSVPYELEEEVIGTMLEGGIRNCDHFSQKRGAARSCPACADGRQSSALSTYRRVMEGFGKANELFDRGWWGLIFWQRGRASFREFEPSRYPEYGLWAFTGVMAEIVLLGGTVTICFWFGEDALQ